MGKNGLRDIGGMFGDSKKGGFEYEYDARDVLKPYLGTDVRVSGFIEKLSMTKGSVPKPSAFIIDVEIEVAGKVIEFDYLWLETDLFKDGEDYVFDAKIISYITKRGTESITKYAIGSIDNVVATHESRNKTKANLDKQKIIDKQEKDLNDPSLAIIIIEEMFRDYGYVITPSMSEDGGWQCAISDPSSSKSMIISKEETFVAAVRKAGDIVSFLCTANK